jgi:hypothetical protein
MTSGLEWTVVRCAFFAQNFNEGAWLDEVLAGAVSLPVDQVQEPFVDVDDIADVVVAALTDDRHVGQLYELTGPRLLGFRDAVAEIGAAAGRDISFVSMSIDDYAAMLTEYGLPQEFIWLLNHLFTDVLGSEARFGRRRAARAGTPTQGLRRLRPRGRRDGRVDAVRLNLGERISVAWRGSAHSDGNRARNASRSCCASNTRPRIRTMPSGGRFSLSIPRSHRRRQRFSIEATSSFDSANFT